MKTLRRTTLHSRKLISPLLICSLFFLFMCPFAHSLTPCSQVPVLIPQKHVVENCEQEKGPIDSPLHHTYITLLDWKRSDKTVTCSSPERDQESFYSLTLITTRRLIL
jgi:hypothetical protein